MNEKSIFGYFDTPGSEPAYDPGRDALCPFCLRLLGDGDIRFISLLMPGDHRSYFYGYHFGCYTEESAGEIEGALIDARAKRVGEHNADAEVMKWLKDRGAVRA